MSGKGEVMTEITTQKLLETVKATLAETDLLKRAYTVIGIDMMTNCPKNGRKGAAEVSAAIGNSIFAAEHKSEFTDAVTELYRRRDELGTRERAMSERLYTRWMREKNITREQNEANINARNHAWECWVNAKEKKDFSLFAHALTTLLKSEKERVMSWEPISDEQRKMPAYDRMISEFERGVSRKRIDELFAGSGNRIKSLLGRISDSGKRIRTDFLSRTVTREQQQKLSRYLLGLIGFDFNSGTLAESEHPFTEQVCRGDVRVTTHYYDDSFITSFYAILHEGGHALFCQMLPDEDHECFISDNMTMGMHESVSRFYENVIGRSKAFISLIYPELCDIFPQVFCDVTERELYEAVNRAEPSLIRTDADELTYTLHIIIRYEIEKMLINGHIKADDIPRVWNEKYKEYLGVIPENDAEGALQDSHWSSDFGYFPTYALGNFYNAMYFNTMKKTLDVDEALRNGDLAAINTWMKEHVFAKADILGADEWIKDITGEELTASYFLDYLEKKYTDIYGISERAMNSNRNFEGYVQRMIKVRRLSAPHIDNVSTADGYRVMLTENFKQIGNLAAENRAVISEDIEPLLHSDEPLSDKEIEQIDKLIEELLDMAQLKCIDLPVMSMLSERLINDALKKGDDAYLIHQLDKFADAYSSLASQLLRVVSAPELLDDVRKSGLGVINRMLDYLERDKFIKLDEECRGIVMVASRYGPVSFSNSMRPLSDKERASFLNLMKRSLAYAGDRFYIDALPGYDWRYHIYRIYQYVSDFDDLQNSSGFEGSELELIAEFGQKRMELFLSDPEYFSELDNYDNVVVDTSRNLLHAGLISPAEYRDTLWEIYKRRDTASYDPGQVILNIGIPREYSYTLDRENMTEEQKFTAESMYFGVISYIFRAPKVEMYNFLMSEFAPFLFAFPEIPGGMTFEDLGLKMFAAMHPPTYIHSRMVAKITRCLTAHLLKIRPDLFVGVLGCPDAEHVPEYADKIENFAYHASLCHDFGKLIIIDTVSVYGRNIFDSEFNIIKEHTKLGAMLLEKHESTKAYADVARGHHKWYNDKRGYPEEFSVSESPLSVIIAITTCADCMDAATDRVGRSYSGSKTLDQFIVEVGEKSGTQYAPYLYEMLEVDAVYDDLLYLLTNGRQQAYRDTYQLLKGVQR